MGGLFGSPKMPEVEMPEPETPAPLPDEEALERARRRRIKTFRNRHGKKSTELASNRGPAGVEFSRTLLG